MKTWDEVSARAGRNDMPAILVSNWYDLDQDGRQMGLNRAWVMAEWPLRLATEDVWRDLFNEVLEDGYEDQYGDTLDAYLHDDDLNATDTLPPTITLFRGITNPKAARNMSWTDNPERADWFAKRVGFFAPGSSGDAAVIMATVPREAVLARFSGRGEDEWVIDPEQLPERLYRVVDFDEPEDTE